MEAAQWVALSTPSVTTMIFPNMPTGMIEVLAKEVEEVKDAFIMAAELLELAVAIETSFAGEWAAITLNGNC